ARTGDEAPVAAGALLQPAFAALGARLAEVDGHLRLVDRTRELAGRVVRAGVERPVAPELTHEVADAAPLLLALGAEDRRLLLERGAQRLLVRAGRVEVLLERRVELPDHGVPLILARLDAVELLLH